MTWTYNDVQHQNYKTYIQKYKKEIFKTMDMVKQCALFKGCVSRASELETANAMSVIYKSCSNM